jgi:hypothetical protein
MYPTSHSETEVHMRLRMLASLGILTVPILVGSVARPAATGPLQVAPNEPKSPAPQSQPPAKSAPSTKKYTTPRTPWGEPDLQGTWSYANLTPLERPGSQAGRDVLDDEEVAALDKEARTGADRRDGTPEADLARAYNAFWYDRGTSDGRTSLIVDPADGRLPSLTPEGRRRQAAAAAHVREHEYDSAAERPLQERCITYHGVPPLPSGYNNTYQIFQTPGYVAIVDENIHDVRGIPLNGRPHLGRNIRQWNGDSRGHWEGDTLVVETTNYSPKSTFKFPVAGETMHAIERFTRVAADRIDYRFTITDPTTYTRPWTASLPLMGAPDYVIYEYACHEGNYAIANALSGARTKEKGTVEGGTKN